MASDKMDKYLQKKPKYIEVETIDKVFKKSLAKNAQQTKKDKKKIEKMLIRDGKVDEGEMDMYYFSGQGNYHQAIRYGTKPDVSRRTRQQNLQFAREILEAEGILTSEIDEGIKKGIEEI